MEERKYCVYMHVNKINGKIYVGLTCQELYDRWKNGWGYYTQVIFWRAIQKYTFDGFYHIIVDNNLSKQEAKELEKQLIAEYNTTDRRYGYNVSCGGDFPDEAIRSWKGKHHSRESKEKISNANKGRKRPDNIVRHMGNNYSSKHVYQYDLDGKFICEFTSTREAERKTGIVHNSISSCCLGKTITAGGFIWSYDKFDFIVPPKDKKKKSVIQIDKNTRKIINTFDSAASAAKYLGVCKSSITNCLNGRSKSAGGFNWMYLDEYERGVA